MLLEGGRGAKLARAVVAGIWWDQRRHWPVVGMCVGGAGWDKFDWWLMNHEVGLMMRKGAFLLSVYQEAVEICGYF